MAEPSAALHDPTRVLVAGPPLARARAVTILLHGRGGSADDIASLATVLAIDGLTFLVPEATGHTWYPQRFLAPLAANEPWLGSALGVVATLVAQATAAGVPPDRIAIAGFSQGACLALEFVARTPARYGAAIAFSGGLIGPAGRAAAAGPGRPQPGRDAGLPRLRRPGRAHSRGQRRGQRRRSCAASAGTSTCASIRGWGTPSTRTRSPPPGRS